MFQIIVWFPIAWVIGPLLASRVVVECVSTSPAPLDPPLCRTGGAAVRGVHVLLLELIADDFVISVELGDLREAFFWSLGVSAKLEKRHSFSKNSLSGFRDRRSLYHCTSLSVPTRCHRQCGRKDDLVAAKRWGSMQRQKEQKWESESRTE